MAHFLSRLIDLVDELPEFLVLLFLHLTSLLTHLFKYLLQLENLFLALFESLLLLRKLFLLVLVVEFELICSLFESGHPFLVTVPLSLNLLLKLLAVAHLLVKSSLDVLNSHFSLFLENLGLSLMSKGFILSALKLKLYELSLLLKLLPFLLTAR